MASIHTDIRRADRIGGVALLMNTFLSSDARKAEENERLHDVTIKEVREEGSPTRYFPFVVLIYRSFNVAL